jgi:hypothetical protein
MIVLNNLQDGTFCGLGCPKFFVSLPCPRPTFLDMGRESYRMVSVPDIDPDVAILIQISSHRPLIVSCV